MAEAIQDKARICAQCGAWLSSEHIRYCSRQCYTQARAPKRTCQVCGAPTRKRFFCSINCRSIAWRMPLREVFERHFVEGAPGDCWEWMGNRNKAGYGTLSHFANLEASGRKTELAHRIAYRLYVGPIPPGLIVCHTCDNPPCVNPAHFFLGTSGDNSADMAKKGRAARGPEPGAFYLRRGTAHHHAKLTDAAVIHIYESGDSGRSLAQRFGVSPGTIHLIRQGKIWTHITSQIAPFKGQRRARARGSEHGRAILSEADVLAICAQPERTGRVLAAEYGVNESAISNIRTGKNWSWLTIKARKG
jgi:hypothetical protein